MMPYSGKEEITESVECGRCGRVEQYTVPSAAIEYLGFGRVFSVDWMPDGYLMDGEWVCDDCGSCSCCGKESLNSRVDGLCCDCQNGLCPIGELHNYERS